MRTCLSCRVEIFRNLKLWIDVFPFRLPSQPGTSTTSCNLSIPLMMMILNLCVYFWKTCSIQERTRLSSVSATLYNEEQEKTEHSISSSRDSDVCDPLGILSGNRQHARVQLSVNGSNHPSLGRTGRTARSLSVSFDSSVHDPLRTLLESMQDSRTQSMFSCTQASHGKQAEQQTASHLHCQQCS